MRADTPCEASVPERLRVGAGPWFVALLCLAPALTAPGLPFTDFYAHALRYAILADAGRDPWLAENYRAAWKLLPNLGLDILGAAVFRVLPALAAAKVMALVAIVAPFAGVLVLARCLHGRVSVPTVALAGILAHSYVLGWGFANFLLGLGLALAALGLWIALSGRPGRQLMTAIPAGVVIFFAHGFVFALWGLMLFAVEVTYASSPGLRTLPARAGRLLLVAALPVALFLASATAGGEGGLTGGVGNIARHLRDGDLASRILVEAWVRLDATLRVAESGWPVVDRWFGLALWGLIAAGFASRQFRLDPRLRLLVAGLVALLLLLPPGLFGVGRLPERMPLVLLAVLAAGIAPRSRAARPGGVAAALVALLLLHLGMVALAWDRAGQNYRDFLAAAEALPGGGLAAPAFAADDQDRDSERYCKPLSFLLGLVRGQAVPTFANPTQQPLEIIGPLAAAMATYDARAAAEPDLAGTRQVSALIASGFDAVVLCHAQDAAAVEVADARIAGAGRGWTLYRALTER